MSTFPASNMLQRHATKQHCWRSSKSSAFAGTRLLCKKAAPACRARVTALKVRAEKVVGIDLGTTNSAVCLTEFFAHRFPCSSQWLAHALTIIELTKHFRTSLCRSPRWKEVTQQSSPILKVGERRPLLSRTRKIESVSSVKLQSARVS